MVDRLSALRGNYGDYRVATSLHGCGRADILFTKVVWSHRNSYDCTSAMGTSIAVDNRAGISIVDWDSVHGVVGDSCRLHRYYGRRFDSDHLSI